MGQTGSEAMDCFKRGKVTGQIAAYFHAADVCELNEQFSLAADFRELARAAMERRERGEY